MSRIIFRPGETRPTLLLRPFGFEGATERNRGKRRTREIFFEAKKKLRAGTYIISIPPIAARAPFHEYRRELKESLARYRNDKKE